MVPPDVLRIIALSLSTIDIYAMIRVFKDFTNNEFWKIKLLKEYPNVNLNRITNFKNLYRRYYIFKSGKSSNVVTVDKLEDLKISELVNGDLIETDEVKPKYYVFINGKIIKEKKVKLIEEWDLEYFRYSNDHGSVIKLNVDEYLIQITKNTQRYTDYHSSYFYLSYFYDWRGIKYIVGFTEGINLGGTRKWYLNNDFTSESPLRDSADCRPRPSEYYNWWLAKYEYGYNCPCICKG
jgi:hypothetical protein